MIDVTNQELDFRQFLEDISMCFVTQEITDWSNRISLPFTIVTKEGPVVMTDGRAVEENFRSYLTACEIMSIDLITRRPIQLEDCGDGTWLGTYETRLLSHGRLATQPYISTALLHWDGRAFKMSSILNGRGHHDWTGERPIE